MDSSQEDEITGSAPIVNATIGKSGRLDLITDNPSSDWDRSHQAVVYCKLEIRDI